MGDFLQKWTHFLRSQTTNFPKTKYIPIINISLDCFQNMAKTCHKFSQCGNKEVTRLKNKEFFNSSYDFELVNFIMIFDP